jgi:predicted glycoside hydrolase/deacetylase ChbG (UPF0249 family)
LHLNFSEPFCKSITAELRYSQGRLIAFLRRSPYLKVIYNPFLARHFEYVFKAQFEEFLRIYGKKPSHVDGHHHFHLCSNILFGNIIPSGMRVRRNYSYSRSDKPWPNRLCRGIADILLKRNYASTDYFFAMPEIDQINRLQAIMELADKASVELMTHPAEASDFSILMGEDLLRFLSGVRLGTHADIEYQ